MTWSLTDKREEARLRAYFEKAKVDCTKPVFCDTPEFLALEANNPRILESYAHLIEAQQYSDEYLADAERKISVVAEAMRGALEADGGQGRCIHASGTLGRMLDHLGIWNYQAKATLTIEFAQRHKIQPVYFWALDEGKFYAPHAIVVAPPFGIIDVSLRHQPFSRDVKLDLIPKMILAKEFKKANYAEDDLANQELRLALKMGRIPFGEYMKRAQPQMLEVINALPPRAILSEDAGFKYVIVAGAGMEETLPDLTWKFAGRTPMEIFERDITPKL